MKLTFIFFAGEEWTIFSQRTQSLAIELAERGHRIIYLEPMLSVGKCAQYLFSRKALRLPTASHANITLLRPFLSLSTFRGSRTQVLDKLIFAAWFRYARWRYGISGNAFVYINLPYWWGNIVDRNTFPDNQIVFDCLDDCAIFSRNQRILKIMEAAERELAHDADIVLATAQKLVEKLHPLSKNVHLVSNGVDTARFIDSEYELPSDIAGYKRPILGFVGALFHWIDFGVFEHLARAFPDATIVLIGPTNRTEEITRMIDLYPNICYLGARPYSQVPDYLRTFDVSLNPFKMDHIGDTVNPLKLYEYLCTGKPVISAKTKEMIKFGEYVYLYDNYEALIDVTRAALNEDDAALQVRRIEFAKKNSWATKVDTLLKLLATETK